MTRRITIVFVALSMALTLQGNEPQQKFSPEKFQQELEQFITDEAQLTPQEAAKFFPVYREMQERQRALMAKMKDEGRVKPQQEAACKQYVQQRDQMELEQKKIQQTYHTKFFDILPASKVYDIIKAEDRFHRRMFRNWGKGPGGQHNGSKGQPGQHNKTDGRQK